jgi:hypothetical protein
MPPHLFRGALRLDYSTAVRADTPRQDYSVCPRHWYLDAEFRCGGCGEAFVFTVEEQRFWYEQLRFYVDSIPKLCRECRRELRELKALRQEYDRDVESALGPGAGTKQRERLLAVIAALDAGGVHLPDKVRDTRRVLAEQVERLRRSGAS